VIECLEQLQDDYYFLFSSANVPVKPEPRQVFQVKYSKKKAQENSDQFMQQFSHGGAFINTRHAVGKESIIFLEKKLEASKRVGILKFDGTSVSGTCFRVGENKVMTALHVIQIYLNASKFQKS